MIHISVKKTPLRPLAYKKTLDYQLHFLGGTLPSHSREVPQPALPILSKPKPKRIRRKTICLEELTEAFYACIDMTGGPDACWLWQGKTTPSGYGTFHSKPAHRYMFEITYGPIPPKMCVCHSCDMPPCENPEHFFLGTTVDNTMDMVAKRRHIKIIITDDVRVAIKEAWRKRRMKNGRTACYQVQRIAKRFKISTSTLSAVVNGRK